MPDYLLKTTLPARGDHPAEPAQFTRERIVRAKNEAAALKHVVADTITITRATMDDAMRLASVGLTIEKAAE